MKTNFIFFSILFCSIVCLGQNDQVNAQTKSVVDTSFIKDISEKLIIRLNSDSKIDFYKVNSADAKLELYPNSVLNYSIGVDYKFIGFSIGLPKKWFQSDEQIRLKGKTSISDLKFNFFFNKWKQSIYFQRVKGFYVKNYGDFNENWIKDVDPYLQFPNFDTQRYGGSTSYIFNGNKFSYRSFLQQTQIQLKSVGSFIPAFSYEYHIKSNKIDGSEKDYNKSLILTPSLSYQYNCVISKSFNLSAGAITGIGFGYLLKNNSNDDNNWEKSYNYGYNLNLNFQKKNFFAGVQYLSNNSYEKEESTKITNTVNYFNLFLGFRFNAPKWLNKNTEKIENLIYKKEKS